MKARYTTKSGQITFEVEGESAKALFRELASIQEVFDAERTCGACGGADIRLLARKVDDYDFYELACNKPECRARFEFGQTKKGGNLFPKRKDDDGHYLPHGGWSRFEAQSSSPPVPPVQSTTPSRPANTGTPEGLQPSFDRIGVLLGKTAPTRLGPALDLVRDAMHDAAGDTGTGQFESLYREYEASAGKGSAVGVKALLRGLMGALDNFKGVGV